MGYFQLSLILVFIIFIMVLCYLVSRRVIITPEFIFAICFLPQIAYAFAFVQKWDLILSWDTVLVYIIGIFSFFALSVLFRETIFKSLYRKRYGKNKVKTLKLKNWKLIMSALFQIAAIVIMSKSLMDITNGSSLSSAIDIYTMNSKNSGMSVPFLPGKVNLFSYLSGFVWMYYLVHTIVYKEKGFRLLLLLNLALSFISNLLTGSRGGVIQILVAGVYTFFLLWGQKFEWKKTIKFRSFFKIVLIACIIILLFKPSLELIGRSTSANSVSDYIGLYISAEIKNLDTKIVQGAIGFQDISTWQTMNAMISKIFSIFGIEGTKMYADASTYMVYKGIQFGNVYTIFYPFITDMGYFGLLFFGGIMGFLCQLSYCKAIEHADGLYCLEMSKLIYSFLLAQLSFSFFSNWFFDVVLSSGFIWCLIVWIVFRIYLENDSLLSKRKFRIWGRKTITLR